MGKNKCTIPSKCRNALHSVYLYQDYCVIKMKYIIGERIFLSKSELSKQKRTTVVETKNRPLIWGHLMWSGGVFLSTFFQESLMKDVTY